MTVNHLVAGSSPAEAAKFGDVGKLVTPADCKSAASGIVGSKPTVSTNLMLVSNYT